MIAYSTPQRYPTVVYKYVHSKAVTHRPDPGRGWALFYNLLHLSLSRGLLRAFACRKHDVSSAPTKNSSRNPQFRSWDTGILQLNSITSLTRKSKIHDLASDWTILRSTKTATCIHTIFIISHFVYLHNWAAHEPGTSKDLVACRPNLHLTGLCYMPLTLPSHTT